MNEEQWFPNIDVVANKPVLVIEDNNKVPICQLNNPSDSKNKYNSLLIADLPNLYSSAKQMLSIIDTPIGRRKNQNKFFDEALVELREIIDTYEKTIKMRDGQ